MTRELDTTLAVTHVLDALGVLYCVGGSFASTVYGEERATRDVDILAIASAEDTVLAKLEWYRMGNEVSDRQWRDVLAVLAAQSDRLEYAYLRQWASALGVADVLERALGDAASHDPRF